jgi:hypothetical protein
VIVMTAFRGDGIILSDDGGSGATKKQEWDSGATFRQDDCGP